MYGAEWSFEMGPGGGRGKGERAIDGRIEIGKGMGKRKVEGEERRCRLASTSGLMLQGWICGYRYVGWVGGRGQ